MSKETLKKEWTTLYRETLPSLAKKRSSVQSKWPVHLDHCFARIILDNAVGKDQPWTKVLKSPAVNNMDEGQLKASIEMGRAIAEGKVELVALDNKSLELRGKKQKSSDSGGRQSGSTHEDSKAGASITARRSKKARARSTAKDASAEKAS